MTSLTRVSLAGWGPATRTNVDTDKTLLKSCHFGPTNLYCPIFHVGSVVRWAGSTFEDIALEVGAVS